MKLLPGSRKERIELAQRALERVSRSRLGKLERKKRAFDPIQMLLKAQRGRVRALLPIKYERMAASPFAFFRGSVSIMAADLGLGKHTGLNVQLCGDAHVQNMGSFEAPDGRIVFDINDFDETIAGPWDWDVKRMSASIVLAGMVAGHGHGPCREATEAFSVRYVNTVKELADEPILSAARHRLHGLSRTQAGSAALQQAARAQPQDLVNKYTESPVHGEIRFREMRPALWPLKGKDRNQILAALRNYRKSLPPERLHLFDFYRPVDVAFKIVGTGSVGLRDYVVLMEGNGKSDALFLQIKQEAASAYVPYLRTKACAHEGYRVVEGQRRIQPLSDLLLGWTRIAERDYVVRQLNDHKGRIDIAKLRGSGLLELAEVAGGLLARGHARSGDPLAIATYIGSTDEVTEAIVKYGIRYTRIVEADFELFQKAMKQGRMGLRA